LLFSFLSVGCGWGFFGLVAGVLLLLSGVSSFMTRQVVTVSGNFLVDVKISPTYSYLIFTPRFLINPADRFYPPYMTPSQDTVRTVEYLFRIRRLTQELSTRHGSSPGNCFPPPF